jgi:DNA-binding CsgD family transcriptional regulator
MTKSLVHPNTKQSECCQLMIQGYSSREIGEIMHLSPRTVEYYINILKNKFGAKNRAHLTSFLNQCLMVE